MSRYKRLYDTLVKNDELLIVFPTLTGEWKTDKKVFIEEQDNLENISNETLIEDDTLYGEF
jgi:hypothetical protein